MYNCYISMKPPNVIYLWDEAFTVVAYIIKLSCSSLFMMNASWEEYKKGIAQMLQLYSTVRNTLVVWFTDDIMIMPLSLFKNQ